MNTEHFNDPDLTDAEKLAIEQDKTAEPAAPVEPATPAEPVEPQQPQQPAPSATDDAALRLAEAAQRLAGAADAITARAAEPAQPAQPAQEATPPRDYDAELRALEQKFDDGEIDLQAYRAEERKILREQVQADVAETVRKENERAALEAQQRSEEEANRAWEAAQTRFFADPGNAELVKDPIKAAGFKAAVDIVFKDAQGQITYDDLLVKARERLTGVAAVDPQKAIREAQHQRDQAAGGSAPQTLRDVPNAGNADDSPGASLDNLDISTLEDKLFTMSDEDRRRYLAGAPGGLHDNPRSTS